MESRRATITIFHQGSYRFFNCKIWLDPSELDAGLALEISNEVVIDDCLQEYRRLADEDEKFLLMRAILYALDEVTNIETFEQFSRQVYEILNQDFNLHAFTIYYWTIYGNIEIEEFRITPLMREVWEKNKK